MVSLWVLSASDHLAVWTVSTFWEPLETWGAVCGRSLPLNLPVICLLIEALPKSQVLSQPQFPPLLEQYCLPLSSLVYCRDQKTGRQWKGIIN